MLEYTSREIVQAEKQYDMLLASLEYCDEKDKEDLYIELDKIQENILSATNDIYEETYNKLISKHTSLIDEEQEKLTNIISLIEDRIKYINEKRQKHKDITGTLIEIPKVLGEEKLADYKNKIEIINKYKQNIKLKKELNKEISVLEEKEKIYLSKLKANDKINVELEAKMQDILSKSFEAMDLFSLLERTEEIELAYKELSFAKEKAMENVESAQKSFDNELIIECKNMLDSIALEYDKYFEKKMLLELLNIYDKPVDGYDELLAKREKMQDIFMNIEDSDFYKLVSSEMEKQYNTIKIEEQDVKTYREIIDDLNERKQKIEEIDFENSSDEFSEILDQLIKNEKAKQEQLLQEQRKKEYDERQRKLILENKKQEELKRKQILIDEARRKEEQRLQEEKYQQELNRIEEQEQRKKDEPKIIPTSTIEAKSKTIHVPKDIVFDDGQNIKKSEDTILNNSNSRESLFESIYEEMKKKLDSDNSYTSYDPFEYKEETIDDIFKDIDTNHVPNNNDFSIPVIKNDNLVAKKVKDEVINREDVESAKGKGVIAKQEDDNLFINDVVFPDMPM